MKCKNLKALSSRLRKFGTQLHSSIVNNESLPDDFYQSVVEDASKIEGTDKSNQAVIKHYLEAILRGNNTFVLHNLENYFINNNKSLIH